MWKSSGKTRRIVNTLCFFLLCLFDQRIRSCPGLLDGWYETFRNLSGLPIAVLLLAQYRLQDFRRWKWPYIVWTVVGAAGGTAACFWGAAHRPFLNAWIAAVLDVVAFGYVILHVVIQVALEKKVPKLNWKYLSVAGFMLLWAIFSRSGYVWPACYLVMFACFVLTDFTEEQEEDLFQGMLNGIILGFFCLQGLAFVFRPYDVVRYVGIYSNPNLNGLFYLVVLAAVITKLLDACQASRPWFWRLFYFLGWGTVLSFLLLSIGRTALIVAAVLSLLGLWGLSRLKKHFWKNTVLLALCALLTFPLCFGAARYLPPLFHHPVWFYGEYSEDKVHSWDPWNSDKYVDFDEWLEGAFGRVYNTVKQMSGNLSLKAEAAELDADVMPDGTAENVADELAGVMPDGTAENVANELVGVMPDGTVENGGNILAEAAANGSGEDVADEPAENGADELVYDFPEGIENSGVSGNVGDVASLWIRGSIYRYYAERLNWRGYPREEQGFWLLPDFFVGHAHNIYLQFGTDFGIPVMVLLIVMVVWSSVIFVQRMRQRLVKNLGYWLLMLVPALFGLLEYSWGSGTMTLNLMFMTWCMAAGRRESDREERA